MRFINFFSNEAPLTLGSATGLGWKPAAFYKIQTKYFDEQYEAFPIWDKYSHLAICLRLMESHCYLLQMSNSLGWLTAMGHS